ARFFGLTTEHAGRDVREALLFTLPLMAGAVLLKLALREWVPAMQGLPLFQMFAEAPPGLPASRFNPWLALAYVVFAPFQELIYRGGVQGPLSHFLTGRGRVWLSIVGANVIFSAAHLYVSPGLAVTAFVAGLFWGWLYARQGRLIGVSVSHIVLGFWAFEVVDLGVLE
ncbi:MAG: CPBP family intramembrane metalloprotease, partial [Solirubrobacteraceae bacterium]|nr:CPBP family intramembrane metalloprotease [Solirubrobacteraceae bacterium]